MPKNGNEAQGNRKGSSGAATCVYVLDVDIIRNPRALKFFEGLPFEGVKESLVHSSAQQQGPGSPYKYL